MSDPQPLRPQRATDIAQRFIEQTREHAVVVADPAGMVIGWLGASEQVLGYRAEDVLGRPLDTLFTPGDRALGLPAQELAVALAGGTSEDDRWHRRADGVAVWITGSVHAVHGEGGELLGYVKVMRDRTDLKAQLETLDHRLREAEAIARQRSRVLDTLGHEMRSPLAAISNATALIGMQAAGGATERAVQVLERQMRVLQRLADDLMESTRGRHGRLVLQLTRVDFVESILLKVESMQPRYDAKGVRLFALLPHAPIWLEADAVRLQQVLANLLDNACKYTPEGGSAWVKLTVEAPYAVLRVEDSGIGIEPQMLPRIFELFTQEERSVPLAQGGVGIGLALVKEYVELHGGMVEVRSGGVGKGSEFAVRLPLHGPAAPSSAHQVPLPLERRVPD
ncbi:MAG TPA: PAS domain-containing sensor histidine kinase [Methylibium sp.]|uniref:PAS domain-containing sensor histidine kinase n=1 Tax=Methylibium sp. TaxID=2067992 RepID=UPI002DBC4B8D|nr:PAS domain-containing sensor histidine kinase [Methylibium sp.]HEU4460898.1 PAS domain-containing sensor histidine kinase [Methylibium sp.]